MDEFLRAFRVYDSVAAIRYLDWDYYSSAKDIWGRPEPEQPPTNTDGVASQYRRMARFRVLPGGKEE